mmetsp:Transcript_32457/g.23989  ORF Transcript_32457/g.23989 Transcript_32457/m.23989 type:complete len:121 (+) Transcript_32457:1079-1441(+)
MDKFSQSLMNFSKINHIDESVDIKELQGTQSLITNEENVLETREADSKMQRNNSNPSLSPAKHNLIEEFNLEDQARRLGSLTLQKESSSNYIICKKGDAIDDEVDDGAGSPTPRKGDNNE